MNKKKIIYILGVERSGSTLLNIILGNDDHIASFGELQYFPEAVLKNHMAYQDVNIKESIFWSNIINEFEVKFGTDIFLEYQNLRIKYERWRSIPMLLLHKLLKKKTLFSYWEYNDFLIDQLQKRTNKEYVCDSSKNYPRYLALLLSNQYKFYPILIIRSVYGYVWSKKKHSINNGNSDKKQNLFKSIIFWNSDNLLFLIIRLFNIKKIPIVKYEDFATTPENTLNRLEQVFNLNLKSVKKHIKEKNIFTIKNTIAGNYSLRLKNKISIKLDNSWKVNLTLKEIITISILSFFLLKIINYETYFKRPKSLETI
ncbi:MAG: sulfotransferase [Saprospiraceae bacterium]